MVPLIWRRPDLRAGFWRMPDRNPARTDVFVQAWPTADGGSRTSPAGQATGRYCGGHVRTFPEEVSLGGIARERFRRPRQSLSLERRDRHVPNKMYRDGARDDRLGSKQAFRRSHNRPLSGPSVSLEGHGPSWPQNRTRRSASLQEIRMYRHSAPRFIPFLIRVPDVGSVLVKRNCMRSAPCMGSVWRESGGLLSGAG